MKHQHLPMDPTEQQGAAQHREHSGVLTHHAKPGIMYHGSMPTLTSADWSYADLWWYYTDALSFVPVLTAQVPKSLCPGQT